MNLGKFGRPKRLKRLISFHKLPLAQRNLFESLKRREPSLWEEQTPPPSPQYQSEADEGDNNYYEENPFLPNNSEIDPSNFQNNTMSATHNISVADSILDDLLDNEDSNPLDDSNLPNLQDEHNIPPGNKVSSRQSLIGLDGRPRSSSSNQSQKIFVSNQKALRLTADKSISHSLIVKFQAQLDQNDFEQRLEDLIDKSVIKSVVIASKAKLDLIIDKVRRSQLDDLKNHFVDPSCSKPLDTEIWNNETVVKLLLENFPKDDRAYDDKTSFALRMGDIKMNFDFSNPEVEGTSIMNVTQLMVEYIPDDSSQPKTVTEAQQKEAVLLLIKRWPPPIGTSFNSFCTSHNRKNLEVYDFLENFSSWCQDARKARQQAVSANWVVTASPASSYLKGSITYSDAAKSGSSSEEAARKRKLEEQAKNATANQKQQRQNQNQNQTVQFEKTICNHCNRVHPSPCPFLPWHKEANKEANVPFADSVMGKKLREGLNYSYLSHLKYSDGSDIKNVPSGFKCPQQPRSAGDKPSSGSHYGPASSSTNTNSNQGNILDVLPWKGVPYFVASPTSTSKSFKPYSTFLTSISDVPTDDLLTCNISFYPQVKERKRNRISSGLNVDALLDSGSLAGNFISTSSFNILQEAEEYSFSVDGPRLPICSGLDSECVLIPATTYNLLIKFSLENEKTFSFSALFRILPNTPFDLIIGRETIKQFNLALMLPSHFFKDDLLSCMQRTTHPCLALPKLVYGLISGEKDNRGQAQHEETCVGCKDKVCGCQIGSEWLPTPQSYQIVREIDRNRLENPHPVGGQGNGQVATSGDTSPGSRAPTQTHMLVGALVEQVEQLFVATTLNDDDIDYEKTDSFTPFLPVKGSDLSKKNSLFPDTLPLLQEILIEGDFDLQSKLVILITKFHHIFSNTLSSEPARIPPFDLIVDTKKWNNPKNRGPPRVQSPAKQAEILKQIDQLLSQGIIERSPASYYSQVLLTPKPPDGWRCCIDYRKLNDCTESASWPILNIKQMFVRLGTHKSSIFGVMDLTSGYHQAPLSLSARIFTAFIAFCGVFHYLRLPFGPKRAPSYFQEMMAAVVLVGLVYFICEIYLDDCIVHAQDTDTFISRLETVFLRFEKHNLFLKPGKCKFGLPKVEFCGRVLSKEGISMSEKKISQVFNFPLPVYAKQLKSFLGLANYFRPHVRNHATIAHPLHGMLSNYNRATVLKWTPDLEASFRELQRLISECPTMYFVDPDIPLYLHTDASDYGMGGYLFQIVDEVERPIAFVSRSFSESQLRWSTIQKEAYGIFRSCKEFDALIRDMKFILRTDHKNLLFIAEDSNPMIIRWYMAMQELDFTIEHIAGIKNLVADWLSRLCINRMQEFPKEYQPEEIFLSAILRDYKIPPDKRILINQVHNTLSGHHGVQRTMKKLTKSFETWPYMLQHVKKFVKECPLCQKISQMKPQIHTHPFTTSSYTPMECINIDFVGPYPDGGYVLVLIDCFSRWVELFAVDAASGECTAVSLLQHFGRFGAPTQIRSDRGSHFVNDLIREFLLLIGTKHCLTLAYSKEENSLVERMNKEVNRHLRSFTFDKNTIDDYRLSLPMVQRIINSSVSDRTKLSSSQILFGNAIDLDRGLFVPPKEVLEGTQELTPYMSKLLSLQQSLIDIAKQNIQNADDLHISTFSAKRTDYAPNSYVLVKWNAGPPTRLHTVWKGPMRVLSGSKNTYLLFDLIKTKEPKYFHVTQMKPFHFDPSHTDPVDIARRDYLEFFIEAVLSHRGNKKSKKTQLFFLIKWIGYDETYNSWEPYSEVRDTTLCHDYLKSHGMANHIPKKF
jgi:transposase InsO family protein